MLGTDISLKHQVAMARHSEFLAEAKRQHDIDNAFGDSRRVRRDTISELRTSIATALLRAGSWLMPDDCRGHSAGGGLELRPGR
jgi:hypothetical protein